MLSAREYDLLRAQLRKVVGAEENTPVRIWNNAVSVSVGHYDDIGDIAEVEEFPGCCGIGVLCDFHTNNLTYTETQKIVFKLWCHSQDTALLVATTIPAQGGAIKLLTETGWRHDPPAVNPRTKNPVTLWSFYPGKRY